jgi:hypothetical protein
MDPGIRGKRAIVCAKSPAVEGVDVTLVANLYSAQAGFMTAENAVSDGGVYQGLR